MERILRRKELRSVTGLSDTQVWKMERAGLFPARRQISPGLVGWLESEVDAFLKSRPVAKAAKP
jgi:prophage regulatory protein